MLRKLEILVRIYIYVCTPQVVDLSHSIKWRLYRCSHYAMRHDTFMSFAYRAIKIVHVSHHKLKSNNISFNRVTRVVTMPWDIHGPNWYSGLSHHKMKSNKLLFNRPTWVVTMLWDSMRHSWAYLVINPCLQGNKNCISHRKIKSNNLYFNLSYGISWQLYMGSVYAKRHPCAFSVIRHSGPAYRPIKIVYHTIKWRVTIYLSTELQGWPLCHETRGEISTCVHTWHAKRPAAPQRRHHRRRRLQLRTRIRGSRGSTRRRLWRLRRGEEIRQCFLGAKRSKGWSSMTFIGNSSEVFFEWLMVLFMFVFVFLTFWF